MSKKLTAADCGEFRLLQKINTILRRDDDRILLPSGDDCAAMRWNAPVLVASSDAMVDGVHFQRHWMEPEDLAWKSLAAAVSDLAAKGADPAGALITLGLPPDMEIEWILRMYRAWAGFDEPWSCPILGGDTVRSPVFFLDLFVWGSPVLENPIPNSSAQPGDAVFVTGTLGDAHAGLKILQNPDSLSRDSDMLFLIKRFLRPVARVYEMKCLLQSGLLPTAMTDISDGLARTIKNITLASDVGMRIEADTIPISPSLRALKGTGSIHAAWEGGEDYELLLTIPQEQSGRALEIARKFGVSLNRIGNIVGNPNEIIVTGDAITDLSHSGYDHFSG